MAQIDQLLGAVRRRKAEALIIVAGGQAQLRFVDGLRPLTQQSVSALQLRNLVAEIVDAESLAKLDEGREIEFAYVLDEGEVFRGLAGHSAGMLVLKVAPHRLATADSPSAPVASRLRVVNPAPGVTVTSSADDRHEIDALFRALVRAGGSDLHLSSGSHPVMRVDGIMTPVESHPVLSSECCERLIAPIMPERNRKEFEQANDSDFAYEIAGVARFRANVFRDRRGAAGVFRVIPSRIMTPEELGLSSQIQDFCFLAKGLVLVTGPTGSGKSTTLATMVDLINRERRDHIITIEDPIEFVHENKGCLVNQREVGVHTGSFKSALRAALREDPDIVLVGELRDLETVSIAIETALTGHLVFATLHTSTAVQTVDRLVDQFPADRQAQVRVMLADCLKGVVSQTLLRRRGGGRIAALEVLIGTQSTSNLIREGKTFQLPSVIQTSKGLGMVALNEVLLSYVKEGLVDAKEAYAKAVDKDALASAFERHGIKLELRKPTTESVAAVAARERVAV